jgi:hypothetical protein
LFSSHKFSPQAGSNNRFLTVRRPAENIRGMECLPAVSEEWSRHE